MTQQQQQQQQHQTENCDDENVIGRGGGGRRDRGGRGTRGEPWDHLRNVGECNPIMWHALSKIGDLIESLAREE